MEQKRSKVFIDVKGNARVELDNFHGTCGDLAAKLAAIGRTTSEVNKPDFYESNDNENSVSQI